MEREAVNSRDLSIIYIDLATRLLWCILHVSGWKNFRSAILFCGGKASGDEAKNHGLAEQGSKPGRLGGKLLLAGELGRHRGRKEPDRYRLPRLLGPKNWPSRTVLVLNLTWAGRFSVSSIRRKVVMGPHCTAIILAHSKLSSGNTDSGGLSTRKRSQGFPQKSDLPRDGTAMRLPHMEMDSSKVVLE